MLPQNVDYVARESPILGISALLQLGFEISREPD
jgi:hypothetical protein